MISHLGVGARYHSGDVGKDSLVDIRKMCGIDHAEIIIDGIDKHYLLLGAGFWPKTYNGVQHGLNEANIPRQIQFDGVDQLTEQRRDAGDFVQRQEHSQQIPFAPLVHARIAIIEYGVHYPQQFADAIEIFGNVNEFIDNVAYLLLDEVTQIGELAIDVKEGPLHEASFARIGRVEWL